MKEKELNVEELAEITGGRKARSADGFGKILCPAAQPNPTVTDSEQIL